MRRLNKIGSLAVSEFRVWLIIGSAVILITISSVLLFAPMFDVRYIHVRRQDQRIDIEDIQQALSPLFRQRLLLVTKGQVNSLLESEYPDIDRVEIEKQYPSTLSVSIFLEPVAAAVIVDDQPESPMAQSGTTVTGSGTFTYVTRSGLFVSSPIKLSSAVPIDTLRITDWGIRPQNRMPMIDPEFLKTIFSARDSLRTDFGLVSKDILVFLRAKEFHIKTTRISLWFDMTIPLSVQFQRFREFLKTLSLDQVKEYIDLRIADKIVYK